MKKFRQLLTGVSLVLALAALAVKADYGIYYFHDSGGRDGGAWFDYRGVASSPMGGNVALGGSGTMILDNRTWWPTYPTTITNVNDPGSGGGMCIPWPCRLAE